MIRAQWSDSQNQWEARLLKAQRIGWEARRAEESSTKHTLAARIRGDEVFSFEEVAVAQANNLRSQLRDSDRRWRMTMEEADQLSWLGPVRRRRA